MTMNFPGMAVGIASSGRKTDLRWSLSLPIIAFPVGMSVSWLIKAGPDRAQNREIIAEKAIDMGAPYLFFMDDDTVCPNVGIRLLHHELAQRPNAKVCGGIYCTKEKPPSPIVFKELGGGPFWEWKVGDVFQCKGLGAGCMLIKTDVFSKLPKPWFHEPDIAHAGTNVEAGGQSVPLVRNCGTDDLYFCNKVSEAGFEIWAHGGVLPVHLDEEGNAYTLPDGSYPMMKAGESLCQQLQP